MVNSQQTKHQTDPIHSKHQLTSKSCVPRVVIPPVPPRENKVSNLEKNPSLPHHSQTSLSSNDLIPRVIIPPMKSSFKDRSKLKSIQSTALSLEASKSLCLNSTFPISSQMNSSPTPKSKNQKPYTRTKSTLRQYTTPRSFLSLKHAGHQTRPERTSHPMASGLTPILDSSSQPLISSPSPPPRMISDGLLSDRSISFDNIRSSPPPSIPLTSSPGSTPHDLISVYGSVSVSDELDYFSSDLQTNTSQAATIPLEYNHRLPTKDRKEFSLESSSSKIRTGINASTSRSKLSSSGHDIRSFFSSTTAPKAKRPRSRSVSPDHHRSEGQPPSSHTSAQAKPKKLISFVKSNRPALSQLKLDISNRPTTQVCQECGMSYVLGVEEDIVIHARHHKRVVGGIEWSFETDEDDPMYKVVWREEMMNEDSEWSGREEIVKLSLDSNWLKKHKPMKSKVEQILEILEISLGSHSLSSEELKDSFMYLYLGESNVVEPKRKKEGRSESQKKKKSKRMKALIVKSVCIAKRIEKAYKIIKDEDQLKMEDRFGQKGKEKDQELIKFVDQESTTIYCSPESHSALIGIHRIWTSPKFRSLGLAQRLMNVLSETFIYNLKLTDRLDRLRWIGFSQPSESGMKFAKKWFKDDCFSLFVD
ncbi:hypothetical protein DFH28DRAFT_1102739 [Melampsora americana]|nr:hypothetical protein DFH28DRAFT_1102739 [Melampsora americana]